jgi:hypothetical protein
MLPINLALPSLNQNGHFNDPAVPLSTPYFDWEPQENYAGIAVVIPTLFGVG